MWVLVNPNTDPNDILQITVISTVPLVLIKGTADPKSSTANAVWKVWKETYDQNGILVSLLFMNGSRRRDQVYANAQAAGVTYS